MLENDIIEGVKTNTIISNFHNWILETNNLDRPCDAREEERSPSTIFRQGSDNHHPSSTNIEAIFSLPLNNPSRENDYIDLCNIVQRHKCTNYCERQEKNDNKKTGI